MRPKLNTKIIRALMVEKNMNQTELAKSLGLTQSTLSQKLCGIRDFKLYEIEELAVIFNKPIEFFFKEEL